MTDTLGQVDRFGQPVPSEPGYVMFINEDGTQPRMRIRVTLDNTLIASDNPNSDATMLMARGMVIPVQAPSLPDGNSSVSILNGSEFTLNSATLHVTIKILTSGSPVIGESMLFNINRTQATIVSFTDDTDASILDVPPSVKMTVSVSFDGTHYGSAHAIRIE